MTALFLYGSLRHDPLLAVVLGGEALPEKVPASLADHAVHWAKDQGYPCLVSQLGGVAQGEVIPNPTALMQARMNYYEECFGYDVSRISLMDHSEALIYTPPYDLPAGAPWSLGDWQDSWGAISVEAAKEVMACFGVEAPELVGKRFPSIRARAASKLRAMTAKPAHKFTTDDVQITSQSRGYDQFFAVDDLKLRHRRFDGEMSQEIERAVFLMVDSVTVLPYDPVSDRVLLIEQFRSGPLVRGEKSPWSVEPIAGRIDAGETPEEAARRESMEEAGLSDLKLEKIAQYYPSPGAISEYLISYIGITNLANVTAGTAGVAEEGEDILRRIISFDDLMNMVTEGVAGNGPLVLSAYWLATNRDRLREAASRSA